MPLSGEDLDAFPSIRHVRSIVAELLTRDDAALRKRIANAGDHARQVREEILRTAETRQARVPGKGSVTVQLFALPLLVDFGEQGITSRNEIAVFKDGAWAEIINRIWRSSLDDPSIDIRPLPTALHLNAALGIPPSIVHAQVFRGVSVYEGRKPVAVPMCTDPSTFQSSTGACPNVYLMQAYVASKTGEPVPSGGSWPGMQAVSYLRAWFAHAGGPPPNVRILRPRRFYDALEDAHRAQLGHFLRWCGMNGSPHQIDVVPSEGDSGEVTVAGRYQRPGEAEQTEVSWTYDSTWRGKLDTQAVMRAAHGDVAELLVNQGDEANRGHAHGMLH